MIRVGFLIIASQIWIGGFNYIKNLLYAINSIENRKIEPIVFVSKGMDTRLIEQLRPFATVIEVSFLRRNSLKWLVWRICKKLLKSDFIVEYYLKRYEIDVFSHSNLIGLRQKKSVNWIPDFQHFHLPDMFSKEEIGSRNSDFINISKLSDSVVLSSYDALNDYVSFTNDYSAKPKVLQFVSQPGSFIRTSYEEMSDVKRKYGIEGDYFIIPNQFWKHKNHIIVFRALAILLQKGYNITVVCTGPMDDYRNREYSNEIQDYVKQCGSFLKLLGLIEYREVILLMKESIAVINPSFFEGWSSSVEECKSLGKNLILSNIPVHKEQNPENAFYFDPEKVEELITILEYHINNKEQLKTIYDESEYYHRLQIRTHDFAKKYESIIVEVAND